MTLEGEFDGQEPQHDQLLIDEIKILAAEKERLAATLARIEKFLIAYWQGEAMTFVNPDSGELVSANYEARALAAACLNGPLTDLPSDLTPLKVTADGPTDWADEMIYNECSFQGNLCGFSAAAALRRERVRCAALATETLGSGQDIAKRIYRGDWPRDMSEDTELDEFEAKAEG